ncbi:uncharacterized protein N0V89_008592 [Didymosphaeria variabile]|uniref:Galactose oxidase n=1 Tax=Didymosphaeria variabile TaxID=1932322 RepID=A0A9W9C8P0_9PLEO|nr:uncharacterized protein N0V89_008592 [Didymosphaeria variabile]KAJ4349971.1 hypothetical protein N0V89_008592 [Didymosphaeria variabile]
MEPAAAGALDAAENLLYGAAALVKGITTRPHLLKANLTRIDSVPLPRSHHTLSVVKGRAYIFGGEVAPGELADTDIHVVILPSSGVLEADYTTIKARPETSGGDVPAPRKGHSSVVIGDSIYIFGGEGVQEEKGRVWVFQTSRLTWSYLDPSPDAAVPAHRTGHAAAASELPAPKDIVYQEKAPQQPTDPAKVVPEPAEEDTWGTIFVIGGRDTATGELAGDALAFDVRTRTWSNLPIPDGPPEGASLALVGNSLYLLGGKASTERGGSAIATTQVLDVSFVWQHAEDGTTPLASGWTWHSLSAPSAADGSTSLAPSPRFAAGLEGVTTGQGRHYLLLFGGSSPAPDNNITLLDDIWAFQLPSERASAAIAKDSARAGLKREMYDAHWAEVGCKYTDTRGEEVDQENNSGIKGFGSRGGFAAAKGTEVDGASVVVWDGVDGEGRILSDGWLVTAER